MTTDEAELLLKKYYPRRTTSFKYLHQHSMAVAEYAVEIAKRNADMNPDINLVHTSALLHDIAIFMTHAPAIGCYGKYPYIAHGYLGKYLLESEGYAEHALVCERHIGVGLTKEDVIENNLPLPHRDMMPVSIEEEIVCYADKFFSKIPGRLTKAKDPEKIISTLAKYGTDKPEIFKGFIKKYGLI